MCHATKSENYLQRTADTNPVINIADKQMSAETRFPKDAIFLINTYSDSLNRTKEE